MANAPIVDVLKYFFPIRKASKTFRLWEKIRSIPSVLPAKFARTCLGVGEVQQHQTIGCVEQNSLPCPASTNDFKTLSP